MKSLKLSTLILVFLSLLTGTHPTPSVERQSSVAFSQTSTFEDRSLALRQQIASQDLEDLEIWWQKRDIGDPHKYLLPVILARLSLPTEYNAETTGQALQRLNETKTDLYHFRSIFDIRIWFEFGANLPPALEADYRSQLEAKRVEQWNESGTENHMFMQRVSGLALMDGSGWPVAYPATEATNEAWLRSEINKFLTIGQGEFHSSIYYGYSIAGLLNLYDFAQTPERKALAKAALDWLATNMALRLSWGTAGGAESRGFDRGTWDESGLATVAWLWWGDGPETSQRMRSSASRVGLPAALSTYRPPEHLKDIAQKNITLPFELQASHPVYYSYHQDNQFWETFYITPDYSLGTLINPGRSYQVKGTINAQYATYKLVVRDPQGENNAVISLAGTYHTPMATGSSPGDQYLQQQGTVLYQLRLSSKDLAAGVPPLSHLVLPSRYGQPQRYQDWYIWQIENTWLCARPWGERIEWRSSVSEKGREADYQVLAAHGPNTAWITEIVSTGDYSNFSQLTQALSQTQPQFNPTRLSYHSLPKPSEKSSDSTQLSLAYIPKSGKGLGRINGKVKTLDNWPVLDSPLIQQPLNQGRLEYSGGDRLWQLHSTPTGPEWRP
ncbi:hypothetical protein PN466_09570 [Roseofilum reptotaenium CS-1145]|uniref:Heparinase n=1 Tax=Roseofilum reptotaenium AO1-A TaxID=1925591 RepID=A0A1L9QMX7_9CYAN|nr:hypothetical protein [Roseofilum reptotaenium]MDB9517195.1 hypothetical protein [Roseofilum reptotaenium CS-1145]OJJ22765.1 hypothetical protein BI308_19125 [Roseofilum reptotaenium AO1-A]